MIRIYASLLLAVILMAGTGCSDSSSSTPSNTTPDATGPFIVSGSILYEDVEYAPTGQNGKTTMKPVRRAVVDLQGASGVVLATVTTDESGAFQFPEVTKTPATIRVLAEATTPSGTQVAIRDIYSKGRLATYYELAGQDLAQPVTIEIIHDVSDTNQVAGIFNMLDVYLSGLEYANTQFTPDTPLPPLDVYWPNSLGSYTCPAFGVDICEQGFGIYVLWDANDQDHYDDDVLWHELAHYLEFAEGASDSPGGWHTFGDNTLNLPLAWSEGNADYFQMAVKRWLLAYHPERLSIPLASPPVTYYVDTSWDGTILASLDLANPGGVPYVYATNEVAVAKTLWSTSQGYGEPAMWSAWLGYMPGITYRASSLETFWDGLLLRAGLTAGQLLPIFNERLINYAVDGHEADDSVGMRNLFDCTVVGSCLQESHTLYQPALAADVDIVPIKVTAGLTYTIATGSLTNGADTFLRLLDANGNALTLPDGTEISSDDIPGLVCANGTVCNNGSNYSSRIVYTPSATGILNVEISNAPYAYEIAGAYGGYTLTVTAN